MTNAYRRYVRTKTMQIKLTGEGGKIFDKTPEFRLAGYVFLGKETGEYDGKYVREYGNGNLHSKINIKES